MASLNSVLIRKKEETATIVAPQNKFPLQMKFAILQWLFLRVVDSLLDWQPVQGVPHFLPNDY